MVTLSLPLPAPSRPVIRFAPHWPLTRRSSKALETAPLAVLASISASAACGSRMATSPETVVRSMREPLAAGERSTTMSPLTESAFTPPPPLSIRVRSPLTELKRRSPESDWASSRPETVSARTSPVRPTSVMSPVTPRTSVRPDTPVTTAPASTTPTSTRVSVGTVSVTWALRRAPLGANHLRKYFHERSS